MLRSRRSSFNGVQDLLFIHGFRQLTLYSTSTSISTEVNPNFVNFLVENLGFSRQKALSTSSKFTHYRTVRGTKEVTHFDLAKNTASVITFLKEFGLQQSQIQNVITFYPRILMSNVEQTLIPKTEIFKKLGFSDTDIADIISVNPTLLVSSLNSTVIPAIEALREVMNCETDVITVLKKSQHVASIPKYLVPNVALLRSYGVPLDSIRKSVLWAPSSFARTTDVLKNAATIVEQKLGIPRNSPQFLNAVRIFTALNAKTIESKIQVFKSFGWSDSDVATLVSSSPSLLGLSRDSLKKKLDFLVNELCYEPAYLASVSCLFSFSLEKRVLPRHKVLVFLKENGLIRKDFSLLTATCCTESKFLKKFVLPFKQAHEVYSKHAGISLEMLNQGLSKPNSDAL